jgi:tripartite-type tricarboxylate transporter receptor subunit TctC
MKATVQGLSIVLAVFTLSFAASRNAPAQERQPDTYKNYPNRPVRVIVTTAAGGASDYVVRPIAQKLSENLRQNPQFEPVGWWGFLAPANTPQPIVMKLNEEIRKALAAVEVRQRLEATGAIPAGNSPGEFAKQIKTNVDIYVKVARAANIRAE